MHTEFNQVYKDNEVIILQTIQRRFNDPAFLRLHGLTKDDLIQSGRIGLLRAYKTYDKSKGTEFETHAINCIKWTITVESKRDSLGKVKKWTYDLADRVSFETEVAEDDSGNIFTMHDFVGDQDDGYEKIEFEDFINSIEKTTNKRLADIVRMRLEGMTFEEIGHEFGVTHQAIRQRLKGNRDKIAQLLA
jgi:RNA polymerase sigma factor (sigma-70 family)